LLGAGKVQGVCAKLFWEQQIPKMNKMENKNFIKKILGCLNNNAKIRLLYL
jgi:hypothetical protein